jgi:hypothetical protein
VGTLEKRLAAFGAGIVVAACCSQVAWARPALVGGRSGQMARYATAQESTVYNFLGPSTDGGGGNSALVADAAGNFYGTTYFGGAFSCGLGFPSCGTVFKLTPSPSGGYTESVIWSFQPGQGAVPVSVVPDASGSLYGVARNTNADDYTPGGTVFKLTPGPSGYAFTLLHVFTGGFDGAWPAGALGLDKFGNIFGTTAFGGYSSCQNTPYPAGCGTAFELKIAGSTYTYQQIHSYQGGSDGAFPTGPVLVQPGDTILATTAGGYMGSSTEGSGTISRLVPSQGEFFNVTLYAFGSRPHGVLAPMGGVVEDLHGNLFGAGIGGGIGHGRSAGAVFELSLVNGRYQRQSVLHTFKFNARNGASPSAGVIVDGSGNIYGTTPIDDDEHFSGGTVFELSPTQGKKYAFTELHVFSNPLTGYSPAAVTLGPDGALYGTTFLGGPDYSDGHGGNGVVFKITL